MLLFVCFVTALHLSGSLGHTMWPTDDELPEDDLEPQSPCLYLHSPGTVGVYYLVPLHVCTKKREIYIGKCMHVSWMHIEVHDCAYSAKLHRKVDLEREWQLSLQISRATLEEELRQEQARYQKDSSFQRKFLTSSLLQEFFFLSCF
jgi:hypothetical protein